MSEPAEKWKWKRGTGTGREIVAYLAAVPLEIERKYWAKHETELLPEERRLLADRVNPAHVITRPRAPHLPQPALSSDWIDISHNFAVKLALRPAANAWVYEVVAKRDFRSAPSVSQPLKSKGASVSDITTLVAINGGRECEPEGVDPTDLKRFRDRAKDNERRRLEEMIAQMEEVRNALDERVKGNPELAIAIGKELWQIRGRIDAAKKRLKRRMAA